MFLVIQSFPEEKILFASSSKREANDYFDRQIKHGEGWFELWQEGCELPIQAGGEQFYSPYQPNAWEKLQAETNSTNDYDAKKMGALPSLEKHNLIVTTWE